MLYINNLSKCYKNNIKAVDNLSLKIEKGDVFGFIGQNGAGKTTTIKCVTGILDFSDGEILINGKSIKDNPIECKKQIAYIPDNPDIYEYLSGIDYLNFVADIFEINANERKEQIKKYADLFELTSALGDIIASYSHGMKQKLALISALIHNPKLYILDEPFVGLDPKSSFNLKEIMKEICKNGGSIFFSTHILEVAEKLCNKVGIIKNGKLIICGDLKTITKDKTLEQIALECN